MSGSGLGKTQEIKDDHQILSSPSIGLLCKALANYQRRILPGSTPRDISEGGVEEEESEEKWRRASSHLKGVTVNVLTPEGGDWW